MLYALSILIITALVCYLLGVTLRSERIVRATALAGTGAALAVALWVESLAGSGGPVAWPDFVDLSLVGISPSLYRSDVLSASMGAWCILLGGLCLLRLGEGARASKELAAGVAALATLYSLVYTEDLRAFAVQILLLMLLVWVILWDGPANVALASRQRVAQTLGALSLLGAALLVGRTTGGAYALDDMSLSALTFWPLLLILLFVLFWLGLAPTVGWSGLLDSSQARGTQGALLQGLVLGVPVVVLVLRLQTLITQQALAGSIPGDWNWFSSALVWLGGISAVSAAASSIVWAGTGRWSACLSAYAMGLAVWSLGLDSPLGRYAAVAIVLAFGLGRLTLDLSSGQYGWLSRLMSALSLVGAPLTAGFVGVWLISRALVESHLVTLSITVVGAAILAACGAALHLAREYGSPAHQRSTGDRTSGLVAMGLGAALLIGGALPALWLPQVEAIGAMAGGAASVDTGWVGMSSGGMLVPLSLLAAGALLVAALGWLARLWAKSGNTGNSVLLPTAIARLERARQGTGAVVPLFTSNPPPAVWWLSLVWLERGLYGAGSLVARLLQRLGILLARLEGRYYFPLAIALTLLILLGITR